MSDQLYYPRPRVEDFHLHRIIHALQENDHLFEKYMSDPEAFLADDDLDDDAKALMVSRDYEALVRRGLHPMLVVQFQRRVEWNLSMAVKRES